MIVSIALRKDYIGSSTTTNPAEVPFRFRSRTPASPSSVNEADLESLPAGNPSSTVKHSSFFDTTRYESKQKRMATSTNTIAHQEDDPVKLLKNLCLKAFVFIMCTIRCIFYFIYPSEVHSGKYIIHNSSDSGNKLQNELINTHHQRENY
ncbi:hypothetical protein M5K25_027966 [Dendrobium thyrsiflorum]|uniref:Uncharacterized protein n=1 Tax=Dendrobium thyrsiflorum TaxID=117978 RepID=A0ABD0TVD3_DENTH